MNRALTPARAVPRHTNCPQRAQLRRRYKDFDGIMCLTKLVVKVDNAKKIQKHFSPDEYGIHRAGTLGDFRERIKDFATLIGYKVMEEDR